PLSTLTSNVRYAMAWAFATRPSSAPALSTNSTIITSNSSTALRPEEAAPVVINSGMSVNEVFSHLLRHGCLDLTAVLPRPNGPPFVPLSGGRFGDVYKCIGDNGTSIAIKCLRLHSLSESSHKSLKRATRELYLWSKAKHKHVLELLGVAIHNGQLAMISPWMDNGNLQQYVSDYPKANRWNLCLQVAEGLMYLHDVGMVHGDLKAVNVLVSREGQVKIGDFGNSILEQCSLGFTATASIGGGTYRWMAFELIDHMDSESMIDKSTKTDVFSLGMTILEVVSGRVPYHERSTDASVISALIRHMLPTRPEQLSEQAEWGNERWELLVNCWSIDPMMRPTSQAVLLRMIELC
ncbi:hypothetical protein FRC11_009382, partial [Ceratobasidium sp. 423]